MIPAEVQVNFKDGSSELFTWDARSILKKYEYPKNITSVMIDPQKKNLMDLNLVNNSYTLESTDSFFLKYIAKAMFWMQHVVTAFLFWIG